MKDRNWRVFGQYAEELGFINHADVREARKEQHHLHFYSNKGEHLPIGQVLVDKKKLTVSQVEQVIMRLEEDRLDNLDPVSQFSPSTTFGSRLLDLVCDKKEIGRIVAKNFASENREVFIADGTSGFYTFLAIARDILRDGFRALQTNSLAIVMERSQSATIASRVETLLTGDKPAGMAKRNNYLAMVSTDDPATESAIRKTCGRCLVVLPVTGLSYEEGPFARDPKIRMLKQWIMESAEEIVFIADWSKMCRTPTEMRARNQDAVLQKDKWEEWRTNHRWHLVTSIYPKDKPKDRPITPLPGNIDDIGATKRQPAATSGAAQYYHEQSKLFRNSRANVREGFIEIFSIHEESGAVRKLL